MVSVFILCIVVAALALALAALGQVEGDATAAPQALIRPECRVSTAARICVIYALIAALPIIWALASVRALDFVREEEKEEQQSGPP